MRSLIGLASFALVVVAASPSSPASAADPRREDTDRAFLKSSAEGSITNPTKINADAVMEKLCADLQPARGNKEQRERQRIALRSVYEVVVAPGTFRTGDYRTRSKTLPLDVIRPLYALEGGLALQVMAREGASFEMDSAQAQAIAERIENKEIALRTVFRVEAEDAKNITPCFSMAKSASWALRIEPISYELFEAPAGKSIAKSTTPVKDKLDRFIEPGSASVRFSVHVEGALDPQLVEQAIESKRAAVQACLEPVLSSAGDTGTLAFDATVAASGALEDVRLEVDALEGPDTSECVAKVLAGVSAGKGAKPARVHVTIAVDRDGGKEEEPEVLQAPQ